jgi:FkbM family methyltransferase
MVCSPDGVAALVNSMGMYDFNNMNLIQAVLRGGLVTFIDVGANIGAYTMVASEIPAASVISIEPHPVTFRMLCRNVSANRRKNVICLNTAISDREGDVNLTNRMESSINRILDPGEIENEYVQVSCRTLDSLCCESGIQPDVIKIDVEGHEDRVLAGFRQFLPMTKLVFIEGGEKREIIDVLKAHNFLGPTYFHFTTKAFLSSPQRRREDPVYVNQSFVDIFRRMCINDDHLLGERTTTLARECT